VASPRYDFDNLDIDLLKARVSEKWNTFPADVLPAWVAEMDFPLAAPIRRVLENALERDDLGYPISPRNTGLPEVFAERMQERFDWTVDPRMTDVITDVVQGMYVAIDRYSEPGDGVIVQTPIYPPFLSAVAETKRRLIDNRLVSGSDGFEIDFDALRASIDERTKLFMLCNPHNPTGRVLRRDELEALANIAIEHDLVVVSDEIHGDLVFDGRRHIPIASLSPEIAKRTLTLTSATKAFNIPGTRCAMAHFGSPELRSGYRSIPRHIRGGIGLLGIYATMAAWRDSSDWLAQVRDYLQGNRDIVADFVEQRLPGVTHHACEATYLAWLDCSGVELTGSPASHILETQHLALNEGRAFGEGYDACTRVNFATSRRLLGEVLERIEKAFQTR
jgi:cystathionine beta-lyase